MHRWLRPFLIVVLFAPVALMAGLMACEAIPATKAWAAGLVTLRTLWIAGTVYCLACLALIYQNEASGPQVSEQPRRRELRG